MEVNSKDARKEILKIAYFCNFGTFFIENFNKKKFVKCQMLEFYNLLWTNLVTFQNPWTKCTLVYIRGHECATWNLNFKGTIDYSSPNYNIPGLQTKVPFYFQVIISWLLHIFFLTTNKLDILLTRSRFLSIFPLNSYTFTL